MQFVGWIVLYASERERPSAGDGADLPAYSSPVAEVTAFTVVGNVARLVSWSSDCSTLAFRCYVVIVKITRRNLQIAEVTAHTILISFAISSVVYKEPFSA